MGELTLVGAGHLVLGGLLTYDVLLHKDRPVSAVLWLGLVWALPYAGALGYLTFGTDRVHRGGAERAATRELVDRRARLHPGFERHAMERHHFDLSDPHDHPGAHIFRGTDPAVRRNHVLRGNRVELLVDGDEFYPALLDAVEEAEASVHVQTFILGRDRVGRELLDALARRAEEGVEVRLLYDRFGSTWAHYSGFLDAARRRGVRVQSISQANPLKGRFQVNLRNHRKVAVVDGREAFVGGLNFQEKHDGRFTEGEPVRDYHVRLEGPAAADLQFQFVEDWVFASGDPPERLLTERCFPALEPAGEALVQVVPGGPEEEGRGLSDAFFGAVTSARESLLAATPYFVPDEPLLQAFRYAAMRGVDVRLVLPRRSNHRYAEYAARSLYEDLLRAGVRIYEREPPFMHAKALVVDDVYAVLGSANLDHRSLHLNFELNVEVGDADFAGRVRRQVESEIERSSRVRLEEHRNRPLPRRLAENFCFLFQPVL